ncbi:MAG: YhfC family glutamic-type intramembrane protease [Anaerolineales bacterium]|jgi:uncharacterized membrane protein YhfC
MLELAYFLNGCLMIALPLALGVWLVRRFSTEWGVFGVGALTFAASQLLHLPFNQFVLMPLLGNGQNPQLVTGIAGALAVGFSAGVFEEPARYVAMRWLGRRRQGFAPALMFGAGHGGLEAIILGGFALYALLQALTLRHADLAAVVPTERVALVRAQLDAFWGAAPSAVLMGALERVSALMLHLFNSVLVMLAVVRRQVRYLLLAILAHTIFNAVALLSLQPLGVYITEGILLVLGLTGVYCLRFLRGLYPSVSSVESDRKTVGEPRVEVRHPAETPRDLDDSRYL